MKRTFLKAKRVRMLHSPPPPWGSAPCCTQTAGQGHSQNGPCLQRAQDRSPMESPPRCPPKQGPALLPGHLPSVLHAFLLVCADDFGPLHTPWAAVLPRVQACSVHSRPINPRDEVLRQGMQLDLESQLMEKVAD